MLRKNGSGNKPIRFKRPRVLIVGCGQVGSELAQKFPVHWNRLVLSSSPEKRSALTPLGLRVLQGDLDRPASLKQLAGLATHLIFLAPPPPQGKTDPRSHHLARVLVALVKSKHPSRPQTMIYISTTGVYGHQPGRVLQESSPPAPQTDRAYRRLDAEKTWLSWAKAAYLKKACILRVPGIYGGWRSEEALHRRFFPKEGPDGEKAGAVCLTKTEDVYTNHIHIQDLVRAIYFSLWRGKNRRIYHVCDNSQILLGDYLDLQADHHGWPRPDRVSREDSLWKKLPVLHNSFTNQSRLLDNRRLTQELRLRLRYPTVHHALGQATSSVRTTTAFEKPTPTNMTSTQSTSVPSSSEDKPDISLFDKLGGEEKVKGLVAHFYDLMDTEPAYEALRATHSAHLDQAKERLFLFLCGWLGGPTYYTDRFGHPRLRARHLPFSIGIVERDQWVACMEQAMEKTGISPLFRQQLKESFFQTADWMRNRHG
jgi:truncated hemoglobin YjbI/nucleoside-diphosphate-sugar epimerase